MNKKHILLVEDEGDIRDVMRSQLEIQGHNVYIATDGKQALTMIQSQDVGKEFDLFILDRMLPEVSGLEICKFIRTFDKTKDLPVLMVTALTRPEDIVEGLENGADDYITKPFDMKVFKARVNALLRRLGHVVKAKENVSVLENDGVRLDLDQVKAFVYEKEIELTKSEFKLLAALLEGAGKVLTRKKLVEVVQDGPVHVTERTIDTHVFGLRKKLGECANLIETIRGVGYRIITV